MASVAAASRELAGTAAVVTGSTGIIGRAIAKALARDGAMVVINARTSGAAAAAVVGEIEAAGGQAIAHLADVTVPEGASGLIEAAVGAFGRLDILVNNVGVPLAGSIGETSYEDWRRVQANMLDSAFLCIKAAVPHLAAHGQGAVVNIGASTAHAGIANRCAAAAAKMGLAGLTGALAVELAPQGITVNCVAPGRIQRSTNPDDIPSWVRDRAIPLGREGRPEELVAMVRLLCGPQGRYVTGQTIHVNGGWYVSIN